jgi:tetratricopeptide (TPR) repeat protein
MKPARETINETLQLTAEREFATALELLDRALRDTITEGSSVAILARHAGVIAEQAGDFVAVRRYYELAAEYDPEPWTYLALGDVCRRLGDDHAGRMIAEDGRDPDVLALPKQRTAAGLSGR